jgi:hypothetical protein
MTPDHHISAMNLDLSDDEAAALAALLTRTIEDDPYPLSPRLRPLKSIVAKLRPEPIHEPLPPPKVYEPKADTGDAVRLG